MCVFQGTSPWLVTPEVSDWGWGLGRTVDLGQMPQRSVKIWTESRGTAFVRSAGFSFPPMCSSVISSLATPAGYG